MKRLAILGATGSIGRQTLEVVRSFGDRFQLIGPEAVTGLTPGRYFSSAFIHYRKLMEDSDEKVAIGSSSCSAVLGTGHRCRL